MSWTLRLLLEKSAHTFTDFITLTYSEEAVGDRLNPHHFELFIKRLRSDIPARVRYFCCGEYGGKTLRPHWHVLLFGHQFQQRGLCHVSQWEHGHCWTDEFNQTTAAYVARYHLKNHSYEDKPQIIRMSRRPGIGLSQLRSIASKFARSVPTMPYYPPLLTYAGRSWWLDRHAYESSVNAYLNAGGFLTSEVPPQRDMLEPGVDARNVDREVMSWVRSQKGKL